MKEQKPNFEQAVNASLIWCNSWDKEEISDEVLADRVSELLKSKDGARGFFATSLTSDSPLMDRLPEALIFQLRSAGEMIVDLTVKNLAMSAAMALHHKRNDDYEKKSQSERIRIRCIELLQSLESELVKKRLEILLNSIKNEDGSDKEFLKRWGYDKGQINAITNTLYEVSNS